MDARARRLLQEIERIKRLGLVTKGRVELIGVVGEPVRELRVSVRCRTAVSDAFPKAASSKISITFNLLSDYPYREPGVAVDPVVYHPNVFADGRVCMGTGWTRTEFLDLYLQRVMRVLVFEDSITNPKSPANASAMEWYLRTKEKFPGLFPTDDPKLDGSGGPSPAVLKWRPLT